MISNILLKPVVSEHSFKDSKNGKYTFIVNKDSNKTVIKNAVEKQFGVNVVRVLTANIKKTKNVRTRYTVKSKQDVYKKARVVVKQGQKISIFEEKKD